MLESTRPGVGRKEDKCYPISLVTEQDPSKNAALLTRALEGICYMILIHLGSLMISTDHSSTETTHNYSFYDFSLTLTKFASES